MPIGTLEVASPVPVFPVPKAIPQVGKHRVGAAGPPVGAHQARHKLSGERTSGERRVVGGRRGGGGLKTKCHHTISSEIGRGEEKRGGEMGEGCGPRHDSNRRDAAGRIAPSESAESRLWTMYHSRVCGIPTTTDGNWSGYLKVCLPTVDLRGPLLARNAQQSTAAAGRVFLQWAREKQLFSSSFAS